MVIQIGNVIDSAITVNAQAAKNLPHTACTVESGRVIRISSVPVFRSSAYSRMAIAGMRNK